jgi:FtsP/CotA-like multicopper oxidase with cupredoxin domain
MRSYSLVVSERDGDAELIKYRMRCKAMKTFNLAKGIGITAGLLVVAFAAACGGSTPAGNGYAITPLTGNTVTIHYTVVAPDSLLAKVGPDGKKHDTFFTTDPTNVKAGDVVKIVVTNYDDMPHGMAFDTVAINQLVTAGPGCRDTSACKPGESTVTTFSFTATKAGVMRWHCPMPCDTDNAQWAMHADTAGSDKDGFMAGTITAA